MSRWLQALKMFGIKTDTPAPQLPAKPRGDVWSNQYTGMGYEQYDSTRQTTFSTTYDITSKPQVIRAMLRSNGVGRKVIGKQVALCWGTGVQYSVSGGGDDAEQVLREELHRLKVQDKIRRARTLSRAFGGALLLMSVDDGLDPSEPLDLSRVRRLLYLRPLDRWQVPQQEVDTSGGARDGETKYYTIRRAHGTQIRVHHSRVIRMEGLEVDDETRADLGGWGDSALQPVYDAIRDIDSGGQSLSAQLQSAVQSVYKIKGLHEQILAGNREFVTDWIASLELFRSHLRAVGLDADNEDLQYLARPLGDAVKVYEALMARVAAAADMPQVELFGMAPGGLSSDDASGTRRFYDKITSEEREGAQGHALTHVLQVITAQASTPSLRDAEVTYAWPSLYSPTAMEEAQLTGAQADTITKLVGAGVLSVDEVRAAAAELVGVDLAADEEVENTGAILDPTERMQQARLAIQSGILHLPDTAKTFRPMLGLDPLTGTETEDWFRLVKTSEGLGSYAVGDSDDLTPEGDALSMIRSRFVDQASRIADGRDPVLWSRTVGIVMRELEGLSANEIQGLSAYIEEQWELIDDDHEEFMSTRNPEDYDEKEVRRMMRTRARLRAAQIIRMIEQARERETIADDGGTSFVWRTRKDAYVRPEHRDLDGKIYPIGTGHPTEGFPGDAHGCRCYAEPVPDDTTARGDQESHTPPASVQRAAQQALAARRKATPSNRGMTGVGLARARDLANGRAVSMETIKRMVAYFDRHEVDKQGATWSEKGKGWQAWHGWGGDAGRAWAERILKREDRGDRTEAQTPAKPSERLKGSERNPEGSASGQRGGIKISEETETALRNKIATHNETHTAAGKRANLGSLKAVYRRGAGAFSTSHRPGMTRNQWSMGRVNAYLYLLANGKPKKAAYTTDNDLLPEEHPRASKEKKK